MKNWARHEYGKLYENWPKDEAGKAIPPARLTTCSPLDMEAAMVQSMLEAFAIPSFRTAPGDGQFGELILGMSGTGVDIFVPETMLDDAKAILEGDADDGAMEEGI